MNIQCPSCGATNIIQRLNTLTICPFCGSAVYPSSGGNTIKLFTHTDRFEPRRQLFSSYLQSRGYKAGAFEPDDIIPLNLPLFVEDGIQNLRPDMVLLPDDFIPVTTHLSAAAPEDFIDFEITGTTEGFVIIYPLKSVKGNYDGRSCSFLFDTVTGKIYTEDFPDLASAARRKHYRRAIFIMILAAFAISALFLSAPFFLTGLLAVLFFISSSYLGGI